LFLFLNLSFLLRGIGYGQEAAKKPSGLMPGEEEMIWLSFVVYCFYSSYISLVSFLLLNLSFLFKQALDAASDWVDDEVMFDEAKMSVCYNIRGFVE